MVLKKLVIQGYGPFAIPTVLEINSNVTVLTGQNDTGKTSILRLIQLICTTGKMTTEDNVNVNWSYDTNRPWTTDDEIYCLATFGSSSVSNKHIHSDRTDNSTLDSEFEIDAKFRLAPDISEKIRREIIDVRRKTSHLAKDKYAIKKLPTVLYLPQDDEIRSVFGVHSPNQVETFFLEHAFGENFASKLQAFRPDRRIYEIRQGNARLNQKLKEIIPITMPIEFVLDLVDSENLQFSLALQDSYGGDTHFHLRGSGVRKIASLMAILLNKKIGSEQTLILFDEPETSLHADAQHALRTLLEKLAQLETVQVIYATHSPSMINPMRVESLRLLERQTTQDGRAISYINNKAFYDNFFPIRNSLGLSPADSLLYSPITVIVEGPTEVMSLPYLLKRLSEDEVEGFQRFNERASLIHLVDGQGDTFEFWCRLAKSQRSKPIIFVDGDKIRRVEQQKIREKHPDVPVIHFEKGIEFEQLVPKGRYFEALSQILDMVIDSEQFDKWESQQNLPLEMMFTKRIDKWLETKHEISFSKPEVMRKAVELTDISEMHLEPIKQLVKHIEKLAHEL